LLFDFASSGEYRIYDLEKKQVFAKNRLSTGDSSYFVRTIIAGDMLLVNIASSQANPEYYGFYIADNFEGKITMMNPDETIKFLTEEYRGTEKFTVQDGYIFWNGRLVAPYGPIYFQYYYGSRENNLTLWNAMQQRRFIGWDNMGNSYWDNAGRRVNVFTPSGKLIADFYGENVNPYEKSQFAVAPDGSLYCLSYNMDQDKFELMKLERFW